MPKQPTWVLIAFIATLVLGFLLFTRVYNSCSVVSSGWTPCAFYDVAKDFKDVFGWAIAMYVAYIAARPVWRQLELTHDDVAISSIKYLEKEVESLKNLHVQIGAKLAPLKDYILHCCSIGGDCAWNGNSHAVHDACLRTRIALDRIGEMNMPYGKEVDEPLANLIVGISDLEGCFYEMNLSVYVESEPEIDVDAMAVAAREHAAAQAIDHQIANFYRAERQFDAGLAAAITNRLTLISQKKSAMFASR